MTNPVLKRAKLETPVEKEQKLHLAELFKEKYSSLGKEDLMKWLLLLLISTTLNFSEEFYINFLKGGNRFSPPATSFIAPFSDGFNELRSIDEINVGDRLMRVRYGRDEYRLFSGKPVEYRGAVPMFSYPHPAKMGAKKSVAIRYYAEPRRSSEISLLYFDNDSIYCSAYSILFYIWDDEWFSLRAGGVSSSAGDLKKGTILVESDPQGAEIYLDDNFTGITPSYIPNILEGEYNISINRGGVVYDTLLTVYDRQYHRVFSSFENSFAKLSIKTDPPDASIRVNGVLIGSGNASLHEALGAYEISVASPLYERYKGRVNLKAGESLELDINLKPRFAVTYLPLSSEGGWYINGKISETGYQRISIGGNRIVYRHYGGESFYDTLFTVKAGDTVYLSESIVESTGEIEILPIPSNSELFVNGRSLGFGPRRVGLSPGEYRIELYHEEYQVYREDIHIGRGEAITKQISLAPKRPLRQTTPPQRSAPRRGGEPTMFSGPVIVLDLRGGALKGVDAEQFSENLRNSLRQRGVDVVSKDEMDRRYKERGIVPIFFTGEMVEEMASIMGVSAVVWPRVVRDSLHDPYYLLTEVRFTTGRTATRFRESLEDHPQLLSQVERTLSSQY